MQEKSRYFSLALTATAAALIFIFSYINPISTGAYSFHVSILVRGFVFITPVTSFGIALGHLMANIVRGRALYGLFLILPFLNIVFGYPAYLIEKRIKWAGVLFYATTMSLVVAVNNYLITHIPMSFSILCELIEQVPLTILGYILIKRIYERLWQI